MRHLIRAGSTGGAGRGDRGARGQILAIFALAVVAMLIATALVFDGAHMFVLRRQLQDASDAASLAGANLFLTTNDGCSANVTTTPRDTVSAAVRASIVTNLGWSSAKAQSNTTITCPAGYNNYAVSVALRDTSPTFFGGFIGITNVQVNASAVAYNGPVGQGKFSVMQLDPGPPTTTGWSNGYNGCPSVTFAGSAQLAFQGSVQVDSACLAANGGAFGVNGSGSTICFGTLNFTTNVCTLNGSSLRMVGTWTPGSNIVTPSPLQNQPYVSDPLANLATLSTTAWLQCPSNDSRCPSNGGSKTTIGNGSNAQCVVLSPGVYNGGIEIKAQGTAYLTPGIYIMNGGGLTFSGQGSLYSITNNVSGNCSTWTPEGGTPAGTTWATTYCPIATANSGQAACGVLIVNQCSATTVNTTNCPLTGQGNAPAPFGPINLGGGSGFRLRAFCTESPSTSTAVKCTDTQFAPSEQQSSLATVNGGITQYRNIVIWQLKAPAPTASYNQPLISLRGGGSAWEAGTVYAPSGQVSLGGNCNGQGGNSGSTLDLTLQFISWDLSITGSCGYNFNYNINSFATFPAYGLVK